MNRARPVAATVLTVAGLVLVVACGNNPYASSGAVQPVVLGAQRQPPASTVPAGSDATGQARLIASTVDGIGPVLTDAEGRTLYRYAKDVSKPPQVSCVDACADAWPPLITGAPALVDGVDEQLVSLVTRPDGRMQVTVDGWPVYRYAKDTGPGSALGRNVSADWAAITPTGAKVTGSAAARSQPATVGAGEIGGLGPVLTDQAGNTLYLFTEDGRGSGKSTCDGACARKWPPVLADGRITVDEGVDSGLVGQIRRADGAMQVTVGGWPVYTYSGDGSPGEATGHGVGNTWYAVEPTGCKVDPDRRPDTPIKTASTTGGY